MKNNGSIKSRLLGFLIGTVAVSLILVSVSIAFYLFMRTQYEKSNDQMLTLNSFYSNLEGINQDVYTYTLEGDEGVFRLITDACIQNRSALAQLAGMEVSPAFYRDIRDLEEMFFSYTTCIGRIYDHSYLCSEFTIGSKAVINKYYSQTQEVYEALTSEFQSLYSQLLDSISSRRLQEEKKNIVYLIYLIFVVAVVLFCQSRRIRALSYSVIQPVQALTESARKIGNTGIEAVEYVALEPDTEEEMRLLIQVYNSMISRIQVQIRTIRENADTMERLKDKELENLKIRNLLKTSELKALQMQINPHFLFNTLNMISQTAYMEHGEQTVKLLDSTARLLRYTLDNTDKAVSLAKELEILGHYAELQEYRFGERIQFIFELDERFHNVKVPSMILQPLVENALTHGVGMKMAGAVILIRTEYDAESGKGIVEVCDNGSGMTEEELRNVQEEMRQDNKIRNKIGLSNIYMRLRIFFNHEAQMEITSVRDQGTMVRIAIPCPGNKAAMEEG